MIKKLFYSAIVGVALLSSFASADEDLTGQLASCIEALNVANGQVSTLSGNLTTTQNELSSCRNSKDVSYQACLENYSGCSTNLSSMTNYADGLSSQLQECLANSPIPDEICDGTGCDEILTGNYNFSLFWTRDDNMYSLPVANNIFLPMGFRAYIDSGVVAITEIEEKAPFQLEEGSFTQVNTLFFYFFKGVIVVLFFSLFLWFIKSLVAPLFIPKNKD